MKLIVKGINIETHYTYIVIPKGSISFPTHALELQELRHKFPVVDLEERCEDFDIVKCGMVKDTPTIFTYDTYPIRPFIGETIVNPNLKGEDKAYIIEDIHISDRGNTLTCFTEEITNETLIGDSVDIAKQKAKRYLEERVSGGKKPKDKKPKKSNKIIDILKPKGDDSE